VSVRDYVPVAIQDHAGAKAVLARNESNIAGFTTVVDRTIGSDGDLNNCRRHLFGQRN
jgi:hypothetical protein